MLQTMRIQEFEAMVNLGTTPIEQHERQPVQFTLEIKFSEPVMAAVTDELHDAIDYIELTQIITAVTSMKSYHLIEHLNQQVFNDLILYLKNKNVKAGVKLTIKKLKVPIQNLRNGVTFSCETNL